MLTRAAQRAAIAAITRNTRTRAAGVGVGGSVKEESGGLVGRFSFRQTVKVERQVEEESLPQERQEKSARRGARRRLNSASATAATPEDNRKKRVKVEKSVVGKQGKAKKHRQPVRVKAEPQVPCPPARARGRGHKEEANKKLSATTAPPKDFESVYRIIEELRHPDGLDQPMRGAPVDEIGCSQAADAVFRADGEERNFHVSALDLLGAGARDATSDDCLPASVPCANLPRDLCWAFVCRGCSLDLQVVVALILSASTTDTIVCVCHFFLHILVLCLHGQLITS